MENRGIHWSVCENHFWIEIVINKARADDYRKSINYAPAQDNSDEAMGNGPENRDDDVNLNT